MFVPGYPGTVRRRRSAVTRLGRKGGKRTMYAGQQCLNYFPSTSHHRLIQVGGTPQRKQYKTPGNILATYIGCKTKGRQALAVCKSGDSKVAFVALPNLSPILGRSRTRDRTTIEPFPI
eukprot:3231268-Rhodomonas_salina.1